MNSIVGWRIQVSPQYAFSDLSSSFFLNVDIADEAEAVAFVRNRPGAKHGERVYAVRPIKSADTSMPVVSGL